MGTESTRGLQEPTIKTMVRDDIPGVFHLIDLENWGWEEHEIRRMFELDEEGSLVAEFSGKIVGIVTGICYGKTAFIVHLIVKPDWRNKRLGTLLMEAALGAFDRRGAANVEVHANPEALDFYMRLGFSRIEDVAFYAWHPGGNGGIESPGASPAFENGLTPREISEVLGAHMGSDPHEILRILESDPPELALASVSGSTIDGLLLGRVGRDLNALGPWILRSDNEEMAAAMLGAALRRLPSKRTDIIVPSANATARRIAEQAGFEIVRDGIVRVSRSQAVVEPYPPNVYSVGHFALI